MEISSFHAWLMCIACNMQWAIVTQALRADTFIPFCAFSSSISGEYRGKSYATRRAVLACSPW